MIERQSEDMRVKSVNRRLSDAFDSAEARETFNRIMEDAERCFSVRLTRRKEARHLLVKVTLRDSERLYSFLGRVPMSERVNIAETELLQHHGPETSEGRTIRDLIIAGWRDGKRPFGISVNEVEEGAVFLRCIDKLILRDPSDRSDIRTFSRRATGNTKTMERCLGQIATAMKRLGRFEEEVDDAGTCRGAADHTGNSPRRPDVCRPLPGGRDRGGSFRCRARSSHHRESGKLQSLRPGSSDIGRSGSLYWRIPITCRDGLPRRNLNLVSFSDSPLGRHRSVRHPDSPSYGAEPAAAGRPASHGRQSGAALRHAHFARVHRRKLSGWRPVATADALLFARRRENPGAGRARSRACSCRAKRRSSFAIIVTCINRRLRWTRLTTSYDAKIYLFANGLW
jgi:hypothetical protein